MHALAKQKSFFGRDAAGDKDPPLQKKPSMQPMVNFLKRMVTGRSNQLEEDSIAAKGSEASGANQMSYVDIMRANI